MYCATIPQLFKDKNDEDALKCWNLERIIDAKLFGKSTPEELTLQDLLTEIGAPVVTVDTDGDVSNDDGAEGEV